MEGVSSTGGKHVHDVHAANPGTSNISDGTGWGMEQQE